VHTELGRSHVEVQRCTLSWEVGKELAADMVEEDEDEEEATDIKSNNPHLAGGELYLCFWKIEKTYT
jgi:hypothetical protein